jgi:hypothetical protein
LNKFLQGFKVEVAVVVEVVVVVEIDVVVEVVSKEVTVSTVVVVGAPTSKTTFPEIVTLTFTEEHFQRRQGMRGFVEIISQVKGFVESAHFDKS